MADKMMAAVLYGQQDVRIEAIDIPLIRAGELLVRVKVALTCGTDVKVYRRGYHAKMIVPPSVFGHELAGEVVETGEGVTRFRAGDRVVAANSAPCGLCFFCRREKPNLCEDLLFNNGAYAEFIRIPARIVERNTHIVPDHVSLQDAALTEPLACALKGLEDTGVQTGDTVAVIGLGPIGSMFVKLAQIRGARVVAVGRRASQSERAMAMGAEWGVISDGQSDVVSRVREITGGRGVDVAIEAVGKPETWQQAVAMLRRGGVVNLFGGCPSGTEVAMNADLLHYSELTCMASFHHTPEHIKGALNLIVRGKVAAHEFVHHSEPLANVSAVMAQLMHRNGGLKTAIVP